MKIGEREIGEGQPAFVVAEISSNHMGSFRKACELITAAKMAGADAVKFQAFTLAEITSLRPSGICPPPWDHLTRDELHALAETPLEWLPDLFLHACKTQILAFSSFFGHDSLVALEAVGCPAYKIASPESNRIDLVGMAKATGKPLIVSSPLRPWLGQADLALWCPPGYPQTDIKVSDVGQHADGLSYHGQNMLLPSVAVACGAKAIEVHLKLRDTTPLDASFSMTPGQFAKMVSHIRQTEAVL